MSLFSPYAPFLAERCVWEWEVCPGSNPGMVHHVAYVAQLVEHVLGKDEVSGSIPLVGSITTEGIVTTLTRI